MWIFTAGRRIAVLEKQVAELQAQDRIQEAVRDAIRAEGIPVLAEEAVDRALNKADFDEAARDAIEEALHGARLSIDF